MTIKTLDEFVRKNRQRMGGLPIAYITVCTVEDGFNMRYDVATIDHVWPTHKHYIMLLDAIMPTTNGHTARIKGIGKVTWWEGSGPLYELEQDVWEGKHESLC